MSILFDIYERKSYNSTIVNDGIDCYALLTAKLCWGQNACRSGTARKNNTGLPRKKLSPVIRAGGTA